MASARRPLVWRDSAIRDTRSVKIFELREALDAANTSGDLREALDVAHGRLAGSYADELVTALEHTADNEQDVKNQSRLREAAKTLGTLGREVVIEIIAKIITGRMGM